MNFFLKKLFWKFKLSISSNNFRVFFQENENATFWGAIPILNACIQIAGKKSQVRITLVRITWFSTTLVRKTLSERHYKLKLMHVYLVFNYTFIIQHIVEQARNNIWLYNRPNFIRFNKFRSNIVTHIELSRTHSGSNCANLKW